ncbi:glycoside hydrolase family 5 protein [Rhizobium sp. KVB221]|uniref:Glycoside hydrolase family 5 protein n=1 Tax=Rhizobium setariae TaxID=2801340 RepID=A0A936YJ36_9HYPH|nr:glycoside hydrolase family 5 protein [Rhizobium setariae]MBL0370533.1 glycoside hydrolase family 5 protein [Rhizobium setariae]
MTQKTRKILKAALTAGVALAMSGSTFAQATAATPCFRGINLSGAEFGKPGGKINKDYTWPSEETVAYFASKGFDTVRLPFMWERLQPKLMQPLDKDEVGRLKEAVERIRAHRMRIILDPHNYARYNGHLVGSELVPDAAFGDFWARLAKLYANEHDVIFGLMNEPAKIPIAQWLNAANQATAAIRGKAGADNLILVPGTAWTGAHSWMQPIYGEPNGVAMARFEDPGKNFAFEVHQYLDDDFSGTKNNCSRSDDAVDALKSFTLWLREHGFRGFLGEFGAPGGKVRCIDALKGMVDVTEDNKDVWTGWTYWVAGDWWPATEELNIQPTAEGDRPQLAALKPALSDFSAEGKNCPSLN